MAAEHTVFGHTVRVLVEHVLTPRGLLDPAMRAEFEALGIDPERPRDLPSSRWWRLLHAVSSRVTPGVPAEAAMERLGELLVAGFAETFLGRSSLLVLKLVGPRRTLRRLTEQFRTTNDGLSVLARELSDTSAELSLRMPGGVPSAGHFLGVIREGMRRVGASHAEVELLSSDELETRYLVRWGRGLA